jgi:hypothetical protein
MAPLSDLRARFIGDHITQTNAPTLPRSLYGLGVFSVVTAMRYCSPMDPTNHRLHAACLAMAKQSTTPDLQARWQAMADAWLKRANEERKRSR